MTHREFLLQQNQVLRDTRTAQRARENAIRARIAARHNPMPVLRPAFLLRAAILLAIGAASASGVGSILGYLMGLL